MNLAYRSYTLAMRWSCNHKRLVLGAALMSLVLTGFVFSKMGGEFVPTLDEGDFVIQPVLKTGTSLSKTVEMTTRMENILIKAFPEVDQIVCRIGAAEVPTDPMSMEEIDMIIKLKPRKEWVSAGSKEELADKFKEALSVIPGIEYEFTQPIEMRFNELITGVRADIAVKIFGENLDYLNKKAIEIKSLIEDVPGAADVILEKTAGLPQMSVKYNRSKIAYYGLDSKTLNRYLAMAFGGETAGIVFEGEKRFDMVIRLQKQDRKDIDNIRNLQVPLPNGEQIPLNELAEITYSEGPAKISRDNTHRRVVVSVNVRNRDLQSVVQDIQSKIDKNITLEPGNYISYGGQFENLKNATNRLMFAVPIALLLIFIFLHFAFKSFKDAVMIFTAVPLATVGGVLFLWMRGMPFSVSAGIGFIALFGIAVLNGIVLIEHLKELQHGGMKDMRELILKGTKDRLRPVILTAAAAALGFLPMAISSGSGAEVQRPLATVVIGGLITSTLLTMIALPLMFEIFNTVTGIRWWPLKFIRKTKPLVIGLVLMTFSAVSYGQTKQVSLEDAIQMAVQNNKEINAYALKIDESTALKRSAFSIDKTLVYYGKDQNNIAENGYPLNVFGVEQNFNFPTLYAAQKKANTISVSIAETEFYKRKQLLNKEVSQAWYEIIYLMNKQKIYQKIDSMYSGFIKIADKRYQKGDISRLDMLNSTAKQQQINVLLNELKYSLANENQKLRALIQSDSTFEVPVQNLDLVKIREVIPDSTAGMQLLRMQTDYQNAMLKVERNRLYPDISLGYFNGTNSYADSKNYQGFQISLGIPLFFSEQNAKIKAGKIAVQINENMKASELSTLKAKQASLKNELGKYQESIGYYTTSGKQLSEEIIRTTERTYALGEIDFFQFVMSIENALSITRDYYENVSRYNFIALEINYLTR
jgi:cobalt-zinc-cadmium resistance protein CzcA